MELIIIAIFIGVIAVAEVCAVVLNIRNKHLAEAIRTAERSALTHAENATMIHKQMVQNESFYRQNESFYRQQIDELCAKVIELTEALEEAKKGAKDIQ